MSVEQAPPDANPWDFLPAGEVTTKVTKSGEVRIYIGDELVDTQNVDDWAEN